jgi:hypothetical protein
MNAGDLFDKIESGNLHKEFTEAFFDIVFNQMDDRMYKVLMTALEKKMKPYLVESDSVDES